MLRALIRFVVAPTVATLATMPGFASDAERRLVIGPCDTVEVVSTVQCGTLEVFENRESSSGRTLEIFFKVFPATSDAPAPDPVFWITGGPGLAASEGVEPGDLERFLETLSNPLVRDKLARLWNRRDYVYIDVRGTGRSNGLDCMKGPQPGSDWTLASIFETPLFNPQAMAKCREEFSAQADLTQYTTSIAADDIDAVRNALGYQQINVYGASYGTRLALEYVRRHGRSTRTATLLGVAPSFGSLVTTMPQDVEEIREIVIRECANSARCSEAFPNLRDDFARVLARAAQGDLRVVLRNPVTDEQETVLFRHDRFVSAIRYMLYGVELQAQLPFVIHEASKGNYDPLATFALRSAADLTRVLYEGYWASVKCSEELAFVDFERAGRNAIGTMMARTRLDAETQICMSWPKGKVPEGFHEPLRSSVPILLINGDRDPASPPRLAQRAVKYLPKGLYVELANRAHLLLPDDTCDLEIQAAFIDSGSTEDLDISCAAQLQLPPFITHFDEFDPTFLK